MKKIITLIGAFVISATSYAHNGYFPTDSITDPSLGGLKIDVAGGYESMYMFRAEKRASESMQASAQISYDILGFDVYAGAWYNYPLHGQKNSSNEVVNIQDVDLYGGMVYSLGMVSLDVGYTYYWYQGDLPGRSRNQEVYGGVSLDTSAFLAGINLSPSVYYFYDFTFMQHTVEASIAYSFPVGSFIGMPNLNIPIRAYYGYITADRRNGDQDYSTFTDLHASYMYYGGSIDLEYKILSFATISAGVRYSDRFSESYQSASVKPNGAGRNIWYGAKIAFSF